MVVWGEWEDGGEGRVEDGGVAHYFVRMCVCLEVSRRVLEIRIACMFPSLQGRSGAGRRTGMGWTGERKSYRPCLHQFPAMTSRRIHHLRAPLTTARHFFLLSSNPSPPPPSIRPSLINVPHPTHPAHSPSPRYPPLKETNPDTRKARKKPRSPWRAERNFLVLSRRPPPPHPHPLC